VLLRGDERAEECEWERQSNEAEARFDWRFTTDNARIKLKNSTHLS
jgi:hypothetical protein